jgi:hypothetical protein
MRADVLRRRGEAFEEILGEVKVAVPLEFTVTTTKTKLCARTNREGEGAL